MIFKIHLYITKRDYNGITKYKAAKRKNKGD